MSGPRREVLLGCVLIGMTIYAVVLNSTYSSMERVLCEKEEECRTNYDGKCVKVRDWQNKEYRVILESGGSMEFPQTCWFDGYMAVGYDPYPYNQIFWLKVIIGTLAVRQICFFSSLYYMLSRPLRWGSADARNLKEEGWI
ncbi:MAG: hypothetical protein Harvfovirus37_8 [Harvfovirus sp.]|uniref:Uncharacterized protein n=1 Tax=Harvfovirus sp. TaxID=2487768 RepID=A0A3G5A4S8_9VIRU|nr:MAG: hypothetical protein Harvfovirus37_8 [Harvfovirus sp.]